MLKHFKNRIVKNFEIFALILLILVTVTSTTLFNYNKKNKYDTYSDFIDNVYFKKTLDHIVNNLEPKYKNVHHKIRSGETFDKILKTYSISDEDIRIIKKNLSKKININKLKTKQSIQFTLDQTNNAIKEFIFQISNKEKIFLKRNLDDGKFNQKILIIKLDKKILYKENIISQSLYKAATEQSIPANTIIEFARIYGFQVDFQRDIRKNDTYQIIYEVFENDKKKIFNTGNILFADLSLRFA